MKNLLISSINPAVGKTTFTFALVLKLRKEGYSVGYFKPISDGQQDTDANDAKELFDMPQDLSIICPVIVTPYEYDMTKDQVEGIKSKIKEAYHQMNDAYDLLIIEGSKKMNYLSFLGLDHKWLAEFLDAKVLFISSGEEIEDSDRLLLAKRYMGETLSLGAILTMVPDELFQHFKTNICPKLLDTYNVDVFGIVPNRTNLVAPTAEEIHSAIGGRILAGHDHMDVLVEDYFVGAMEPESALKYFRKSVNKAVITGGDRPQIALAAMETDTSMLILTGGIIPPAGVLARAEEKEIPVVLVASDTFTTVQKLTSKRLYGKIHEDQKEKIEAWDKIFSGVRYNDILEKLENSE